VRLVKVEELYRKTFEEVTGNFQIDQYIENKVNVAFLKKSMLESELGVQVAQIGIVDFMEIAFPHAAGYFCFFQKGGKVDKRHTFYTKKQAEQKLLKMLHRTFKMNTYISYSTYFSPKIIYKKVPKKVQLPDGTYSKCCSLETKEEEYVTVMERVALPRRTQSNIVYTYLLAQDLDFYKLGMTEEEAVKKIARLIAEEKIICPTFILFTGQGIQLIWAVEPFKNIKNYTRDKEWRAVQEEMIRIFKEEGLNPDTVVKNPSAVTRATETFNRKAEDLVRTFYVNAARLTLDEFTFHHGLFPQPDKKVIPKKTQQLAKVIPFPIKKAEEILEELKKEWKNHYHINDKILERMNWNLETLNWARVDDFFTYVREMSKKGIPLKAKRNWLAMEVAFHTLVASNGDEELAFEKVVQLWDEFEDQNETSLEEVLRRGYDKAVDYYNDWVNDTWDKKKYVQGGLFFNNARLLEIMGIQTAYDIQYKMKTIKIRNKPYEAYKKRIEKFGENEADKHTWEAYQERRNKKLAVEKEDKLWQLKELMKKNPKAKKKQLAEMLGVTDRTLRNWIKELDK
jgi:hypothetical protein